jgi:hypothetical protein
MSGMNNGIGPRSGEIQGFVEAALRALRAGARAGEKAQPGTGEETGEAEFLRVTAQFTSAYELLEIARPGKDCLAIEKTKLVGWIKGLRKGQDRA